MALHFERSEFDARRDRLMIEMAEKKLDASTKKHIDQIDEMLKTKEAELLEV